MKFPVFRHGRIISKSRNLSIFLEFYRKVAKFMKFIDFLRFSIKKWSKKWYFLRFSVIGPYGLEPVFDSGSPTETPLFQTRVLNPLKCLKITKIRVFLFFPAIYTGWLNGCDTVAKTGKTGKNWQNVKNTAIYRGWFVRFVKTASTTCFRCF